MTDYKFIPKLPETKTEIVLNQEQQNLQEQKPIVEKAVETVADTSSAIKETVLPTVHASDDKNKGKGKESSSGKGSPKIVQADNKWVRDSVSAQREQDKKKAIEETPCDIQ